MKDFEPRLISPTGSPDFRLDAQRFWIAAMSYFHSIIMRFQYSETFDFTIRVEPSTR
jgi:hypothetical protein